MNDSLSIPAALHLFNNKVCVYQIYGRNRERQSSSDKRWWMDKMNDKNRWMLFQFNGHLISSDMIGLDWMQSHHREGIDVFVCVCIDR